MSGPVRAAVRHPETPTPTPDRLDHGGNGLSPPRIATSVESPNPGCRTDAGEFVPVIDRGKCEGKAECLAVCPYDVFEVRRMDDADFVKLGVLAKLKSVAHGRKTAYTPMASACQACGKCVEARPERAIKLTRVEMKPETLPAAWLSGRLGPSLSESSWSPFEPPGR
jgi:4Fe-4S ferredoxin